MAFSREGQKKIYVQDLLEKENNLVWDLLYLLFYFTFYYIIIYLIEVINQGAIIYVCGDPVIAKGIKETFTNIARKNNVADASSFVENLVKSKRFSFFFLSLLSFLIIIFNYHIYLFSIIKII